MPSASPRPKASYSRRTVATRDSAGHAAPGAGPSVGIGSARVAGARSEWRCAARRTARASSARPPLRQANVPGPHPSPREVPGSGGGRSREDGRAFEPLNWLPIKWHGRRCIMLSFTNCSFELCNARNNSPTAPAMWVACTMEVHLFQFAGLCWFVDKKDFGANATARLDRLRSAVPGEATPLSPKAVPPP